MIEIKEDCPRCKGTGTQISAADMRCWTCGGEGSKTIKVGMVVVRDVNYGDHGAQISRPLDIEPFADRPLKDLLKALFPPYEKFQGWTE